MVEQIIKSKGGLEDRQTFIEVDQEMPFNFLKGLFSQVDDLEQFFQFLSLQHLIYYNKIRASSETESRKVLNRVIKRNHYLFIIKIYHAERRHLEL